MLGQDGQQGLVKYGGNYVRVHSFRLALEHNHKTDSKVSPTLTANGSTQEQPKERHCRTFDEDSDEELHSQEEQNNDREMNMLSNSMERLSMFQLIESSPTVTEKKDTQLKKHEGEIYIKHHKPVEHHNTIVTIRKIYRKIRPGRKPGNLGNLRNLGNFFPRFFKSEFSILAVGQNRKLRNKKTQNNFSEIFDFSDFSEFLICHFFVFRKKFFSIF